MPELPEAEPIKKEIMVDREPKEKFPIGEANKLGELSRERWYEHLLLFSEVKNEVLEINPHVNISLPLEKGKSSPLGLFMEAAFEEKPKEIQQGKCVLEVLPGHWRSAIICRTGFNDKEGRIYRDVDIKGIGSFWRKGTEEGIRVWSYPGFPNPGGRGVGLLDFDSAFLDYQMSEEFLEAGIRTCRTIAIIELKELIISNHKFSVKQAMEENLLLKNFRPVVEIRAFGTKARIEDLEPGLFEYENELLFKDAKKFVAQELGYKKALSSEDYFIWFAKTLGANVALIHKNGWSHHNLRPHNITLDCRIVDLDTITQLTRKNEQSADFSQAKNSLSTLERFLNFRFREVIIKREIFEKYFEESYDAIFPFKEQEEYFSKINQEKK